MSRKKKILMFCMFSIERIEKVYAKLSAIGLVAPPHLWLIFHRISPRVSRGLR